jgi:hypothetical protein
MGEAMAVVAEKDKGRENIKELGNLGIGKLGNFFCFARMILHRSGRANAISQFPNSKISKY